MSVYEEFIEDLRAKRGVLLEELKVKEEQRTVLDRECNTLRKTVDGIDQLVSGRIMASPPASQTAQKQSDYKANKSTIQNLRELILAVLKSHYPKAMIASDLRDTIERSSKWTHGELSTMRVVHTARGVPGVILGSDGHWCYVPEAEG